MHSEVRRSLALQKLLVQSTRIAPVYKKKGEVHKPIPEYGVNDALLSKGALLPRTSVKGN